MKILDRKEKRVDLEKILKERLEKFEKLEAQAEGGMETKKEKKAQKVVGREKIKTEQGLDIVVEARIQTKVSRKGLPLRPDLEDSAGVCKDESKNVRLNISEDGEFEDAWVDDTKLIL